MYHKYFGLNEPAFSIAVNPRYLYMSKQHKEALAHLLYGVQGGGFVMLSGEVGTGKTTIIRSLLEQLPENTEIAIVLNPMADAIEILGTVCDELHIDYDKSKDSIKVLTDALQERLLENHREGRNTVLLIDEAQLLSAEVLEQIRLLTNLETNTEKLLQIVLVGQPELNTLLSQPRLRQLSQRITARFHLRPLNVEETWSYINHRLHVAGMPDDRNPFTPRIIKRIHAFTGGIPRKINIICERILIGAYGHNKTRIDNKIFELAKNEVTGHTPLEPSQVRPHWWIPVSLVVLSAIAVAILSVLLLRSGNSSPPHSPNLVREPTEQSLTPTSANSAPISEGAAPGSAASSTMPSGDPNSGTLSPEPHDPAVLSTTVLASEPSQAPQPYYAASLSAQAQLFAWNGIEVDSASYPCWQLSEQNIECRNVDLANWRELREINRPAVLSLTSEDKFESYALITAMDDETATLLDTTGESYSMSLQELGPLWNGEAFYIWKRPPGFKEPLIRGQRSQTIEWLAKQFAEIDGQQSPLTTTYFNERLEQRVKIFQRENQLADDGIVGQQTLMKLNETLGIDLTLAARIAQTEEQ